MTRRQIAAHYGIPFGTVCRQLWEGATVKEMLAARAAHATRTYKLPVKGRVTGKFATPWGMLSYYGIATRLGLSIHTLRTRVNQHGMSYDLAFNTPSYGKPGTHYIMPPEEYRRATLAVWQACQAERLERRRELNRQYLKRKRDRARNRPPR